MTVSGMATLSLAKTRSMSWFKELRVSPILGAPGVREGSDGIWREPERVDHPQVLETSFGAGFAKQILGDLKPGCRLRWSERSLVVHLLLWHGSRVADHRLTKILVLA